MEYITWYIFGILFVISFGIGRSGSIASDGHNWVAPPSPSVPGQETEVVGQCENTYYIHEYHVHQSAAGNVSHGNSNTSDSECATGDDFLQEKSRWLEQQDRLQTDLVEERRRRLDMTSHLVSLLHDSGHHPNNAHRSLQQLRELVNGWSQMDTGNATDRLPSTTTASPPAATTAARPDGGEQLAEVVAAITTDVASLKGSLRQIQRRYSQLREVNSRLITQHRRTQAELLSWKDRSKRLMNYQITQSSIIRSVTQNLTDEVSTLHKKFGCLTEDTVADICSGNYVIESAGPTTASTDVMVEASVTTSSGVTSGPSDENVQNAQPALSSEKLVEAGVRVSSWYLERIKQERPRGN